jgi:glycosyltransferase involved in cell wall biosynthesis
LKVLLVHNFYGSSAPSGENQVFEAEARLLRSHGHDVETFTRQSDEIRTQGAWGTLKGALATPWNPWVAAAVAEKVSSWKPDVVHVHNTFPLISPSIFSAIGHKAARVLTLHNYRLFCPAAIPMRSGKVCTECLDSSSVWPAMRYGCYRESRAATLPLALNVALHRQLRTWRQHVDAFITLSDFQRQRMVEAGLPSGKVYVKPNFYPGNPTVVPWAKRGDFVVFAGRLTREKGVMSLLRAWSEWSDLHCDAPELRIVGDGPLRAELERKSANLQVRFFGQLTSEQAQAQIAHARLLVLPSECFEGFPMVVREAFAFGTPVAVSNLGPLPAIVQSGQNGVVFEPANPASLASVVRKAWQSTNWLECLAKGARKTFEERYTEDANYEMLMRIFESAITESKNSKNEHARPDRSH